MSQCIRRWVRSLPNISLLRSPGDFAGAILSLNSFVNLFAVDFNFSRRIDAKSDLIAVNAKDSDNDVFANSHTFTGLAGKYEQVISSEAQSSRAC